MPVDQPIGFAINGVPFFSALSAGGADLVSPPPDAGGGDFDPCMGTLTPAGAYGYRTMPPCAFGLNSRRFDMIFDRDNMLGAYSPLVLGAPSPIIGWACALAGPLPSQCLAPP